MEAIHNKAELYSSEEKKKASGIGSMLSEFLLKIFSQMVNFIFLYILFFVYGIKYIESPVILGSVFLKRKKKTLFKKIFTNYIIGRNNNAVWNIRRGI